GKSRARLPNFDRFRQGRCGTLDAATSPAEGDRVAFRSSSDRAEPAGRGSRRFPGWLRSRLVRAWNPPLYAGLILAFLMGRAQPISPVAPFGIAFYMAVRAAGFGGLAALPVALALLGG